MKSGAGVNDAAKLVVSIDVEDWPQSTWDRSLPITRRAADNTLHLLDLLGHTRVTATLFVLGKFAEAFPDVVRRIRDDGHEVASHGFGHVEIFTQTPSEFRADVTRAKKVIEDIIGEEVVGYRAPDFSIVERSLWALEVLAEAGFRYDSSIFPIAHRRYGIRDWPTLPMIVELSSGSTIVELPIATLKVFGRRLPVGGGGYHRLLPSSVIAWAIGKIRGAGSPFVAYCHPYEFDPGEFAALDLPIPLRVRLHQGLGRRGLASKFTRMISNNETIPARTLALGRQWPRRRLPAMATEVSSS